MNGTWSGSLMVTEVNGEPRRLEVVPAKVYGTVVKALLDTGAVPNLIEAPLAKILSNEPQETTRIINMEDGNKAIVLRTVSNIPL